jgi:adenylate cyclase
LRDEEVRIAITGPDEVLIIVRDITDRKRAEASLKRLTQSFARFFPPEYLKFLKKESVTQLQLGDHISKEMAMMFSDIRSFTTLSEQMTPEEHFDFVNTYLSQVAPIIRAYDGVIVKFLGDGMMSAFPNSVDDAVAAGIEKFNRVQAYNQQRGVIGHLPIEIGMGIHVGHMMLGIVGEQNRLQGDAFSDHVNLAARLEGLTKFYGASLIISKDVLDRLNHPDHYQIRFLDRVIVKGRTEAIAIYEILDTCDKKTQYLKLQTLSDFEQGLMYYCAGGFTDAQHYFEKVLKVNSLDKAARLYLDRVQQLTQEGTPMNWDGTWAFTQK